jgi:hypothetical protein
LPSCIVSGGVQDEAKISAAIASLPELSAVDEDVRSYMVSIIADVKPDSVAGLVESIGPFMESSGMDESRTAAVCEALLAKLVPAGGGH